MSIHYAAWPEDDLGLWIVPTGEEISELLNKQEYGAVWKVEIWEMSDE